MFRPRHSGSRGTDTSSQRSRHPRHLGHRGLGVGHVLEHLDRGGHVELAVGEGQRGGLLGAVLEVRARARGPLCGQLLVVEVDAHDAPVAELLGPLVGEHPLAAAHVEHRRAARPSPRARRGRSGSGPSAAGRPGWWSRTCRTCSRWGRPPPGSAHSRTGSRSRSASCGRALLVVRGLHAELQLHPAHPLEDPLLEHAAAGQDVADHAERQELHGHDQQRGAEDERLDVALALAREEEVEEARPDERGGDAPRRRRR